MVDSGYRAQTIAAVVGVTTRVIIVIVLYLRSCGYSVHIGRAV